MKEIVINEKNTDQVLAILKSVDDPLLVSQIQEMTHLLVEQVRTALYGLKRRGKVESLRHLEFAGYDRRQDERQLWQPVEPVERHWERTPTEDGHYWFSADEFKTVEVIDFVTGWQTRTVWQTPTAFRLDRMPLEYPQDCGGCWWYGPLAPPAQPELIRVGVD